MTLTETLQQDEDARQFAAAMSLPGEAPPAVVPGYQIVRRVGSGKYGSVWLAREQNTGKHVAIKFYLHRRGVDWNLLSREVEKLATLYTSRHIVRLVAVGWDHDPPYYVMEYLENGSLAQKLEQGPLAVPEAVRMATRVSQALVHAHGSGILHCDLKPANVLLDADWEPRLCDFGQSRLLEEDRPALGTLFYMAPEQADLKAVPDARWDVYALGALLYHMLCGEPPYRTEAAERELQQLPNLEARLAMYRQIVTTHPRPTKHRQMSGVDGLLADIVDHCLAIDPQRRFSNAQAVLDRLIARERQRARRPLIVMGLVLPFLLTLSLLPFALDALRDAVTTSRSNIVRRALESDALSANLLSTALDQELQRRLDELLTLANDEEVRKTIAEHLDKPLSERLPLFEVLERRLKPIRDRIAVAGRAKDASWFLQDVRGFQRWRSPFSESSIDEQYACRDYFHGQNFDGFTADCPAELPPLRTPHVSVPYLSTTSELYVVAISVPIFEASDEGDDESPVVIGVLARTLWLSELLDDYNSSLRKETASTGRTMALLDTRTWSLVAHEWMTDENLATIEAPVKSLTVEQRVIDAARQLMPGVEAKASENADRLDDYHDPVGQVSQRYSEEWLAAFSPVGLTGWMAIVQEPREPVLRPVENLRTRLVWTGIGGILLVCGVVAGCWWMIVVLMNERGQRWLLRWRRASGTASPQTLTGKVTESA
ncbi:MAG TPA: serine/threonine protein kinase [Planctomycetaceae bacterium]|nr:serine/threonine protein kinase [Planctomycetaceae bacterium]